MRVLLVCVVCVVLCVGCGSGSGTGPLLLLEGDGTFGLLGGFSAGANVFAQSPVSGDFNGDGVPDVATVGGQLPTISYLFGNGDGTLVELVTPQVDLLMNPDQLVVGDFDGNGVDDVATYDLFTDVAQIVLSNGDGTFNVLPAIALGVNAQPTSIVAGRFDAGPTVDLVLAVDTGLQVLLGNGDGTFAMEPVFTDLVVSRLVAADFDGDGALDVCGIHSPFRNYAEGVLGDGTGGFGQKFRVETGSSGGPLDVINVYPGDMNDDGSTDAVLWVVDSFESGLVVALNFDGAFGPQFVTHPLRFVANGSLGGVGLGDLDGDDVSDVVVTLDRSAMQIMLNTGFGGLAAAAPPAYALGQVPTRPLLVDLDRDGVLDVVNTQQTSDVLTVHLGNPR